jgi:hypothetical protein
VHTTIITLKEPHPITEEQGITFDNTRNVEVIEGILKVAVASP